MGAQKKSGAKVPDDSDEQSRQRLQAILLADSFTTKFRPVTLERPKVLLPLANTPMIDYTLSWLESAGIEEVFVFCCAHSTQVIEYLDNSFSHPNLIVRTIESHKSISAGDALRYIYEQQTETDVNDPGDEYGYFEREVEGTFLRAVEEGIKVEHGILEIKSLRLSYNMESADCAGAVFYSMMKRAVDTPHGSASELYKNAAGIIAKWKGLLGFCVKQTDEQIEVIMKFEEMCQENAKELGPLFAQILHVLYEQDVVQEDVILRWAEEKAGADEADKVYLQQCEAFIQWLKEASEEEDDDDEEDD